MIDLKSILNRQPESERKPGIWPLEWAAFAYTAFTLMLISVFNVHLVDPVPMLVQRVIFVALVFALVWAYKIYPSRLMVFVRIALVIGTLSRWYPDTYEFNRLFCNLDHIFASCEQSIFGCQPALLFSQAYPQWWVSEPLYMGYVSYFPMIFTLVFWVWLKRPEQLMRCAFIIISSFFLYYIIYIFLPVAGPQYYYQAEGVDAAAGVFPNLGHYFHEMRPMFPAAGADGPFHYLVSVAHEAGERPTAAFPSSHIGVATILLVLSIKCRLKGLMFTLLPFYVLLCLATVYIHAHYAIDAIAGFITSFVVYLILSTIYKRIWGNSKHPEGEKEA